MSNSSLVSYTKISPNRNSPRNHKIDTITIHCIVGQWTAKKGCDYFSNSNAHTSANYIVGTDGSIGLSVPEGDRSWCSSSGSNDHRAITIECASDTTSPYAVTDACYKALIKLLVDICKRNKIEKLLWKADKSLIGQVDVQNMTVHRWFANKACPGDYLYSRMSQIANEVNQQLSGSSGNTETSPSVGGWYRVRKSWEDAKSQICAFKVLANAIKACKDGYHIYDDNGNDVCPSDSHAEAKNNDAYIEALAWDVIRGKYSNGQTRKNALGDLYDEVQAKVNELLS